jgi:hypothetical protein
LAATAAVASQVLPPCWPQVALMMCNAAPAVVDSASNRLAINRVRLMICSFEELLQGSSSG